jgi:hypothetical protein
MNIWEAIRRAFTLPKAKNSLDDIGMGEWGEIIKEAGVIGKERIKAEVHQKVSDTVDRYYASPDVLKANIEGYILGRLGLNH